MPVRDRAGNNAANLSGETVTVNTAAAPEVSGREPSHDGDGSAGNPGPGLRRHLRGGRRHPGESSISTQALSVDTTGGTPWLPLRIGGA